MTPAHDASAGPPPPDAPALARLLDGLGWGVVHVLNGWVAYANPMARTLLGVSSERFTEAELWARVHPDERPLVQQRYRARQRGEPVPSTYELTLLQPDGTTVRVEMQPRVLGPGEALLTFRDVTQRVRDSALVMDLSSLAARVQLARTTEEVFQTACGGLCDLGYRTAVLERSGDRAVVRTLACGAADRPGERDASGLPDGSLPIAGVSELQQLFDQRRHVYRDDVEELFARIWELVRPAGSVTARQPARQGALLPLVTRAGCSALLVWSERLSPADAAAFALFAAQLSSALEVAASIEHLERTNRDLETIGTEERRRARDLSLLNEFGALLSGHLELPALLNAGVAHFARMADAPDVILHLIDDEGSCLRSVASNMSDPPALSIVLPLDRPAAVTVAVRTLRPVVFNDIALAPEGTRELAIRFGHHALLAVPLVARGRAIGAVVLGQAVQGREFSPAAVERVVALANQLATAVANVRLYEEERRRVRELSLLAEIGRTFASALEPDELAQQCLEHIRAGLEFDSGAIWLLGGAGGLALTARCAAPATADEPQDGAEGELLATRAMAAGSMVLSRGQGPSGPVFSCSVPLTGAAGAVGALTLSRRGRAVLSSELQALSAAAAELVLGLENARLFAGARRGVEELRLLLDVGRAITASLDLQPILEASAGLLTRMVQASNTFILILDPEARELRGAAASNPANQESFRQVRIGLDESSLAAQAARTGKPAMVAHAARSPGVRQDLVALYGEASLLALPLLVRGEAIGVVVVDDSVRVRSWTDAEIERATLVAQQIAVAVANARLFEDLRRSYAELARAQEELVKRERLAALGELSAVVAHEVRNPLGVIFNSLGSLKRILHPTGDAAMLLEIVGEEADRLNRIVGDLLDFARPHEPALQPEALSSIITDVLEHAATQPAAVPVQFRSELASPLPEVRIDARMIRQALLNVVLNGLQAMPGGGTLTVLARQELLAGRQVVNVEIADTGPGIPPEFAERIFQPFFTTKASGTGLGLAVVKRIMEAHGGEIRVQSRPGAGTTFTLQLPAE